MTNDVSLADIAAVTRNNNNGNGGIWGGESLIAIVILFLFFAMFGDGGFGNMFGNRGNSGGGGGGISYIQPALTRGELCQDMNFQDVKSGVQAANSAVENGFARLNSTICQQQYETAGLINGLSNTVQNGFNAANVVALTNQNALQAQLAQCCCDQRIGQMQLGNQMDQNFCTTNFNAANNTTAIIQNAHNDTDRIIARLDAMEMSRKDETIADLRSKLAACGDQATAQSIVNQLTRVINPPAVPAYPASSPCGLGNWSPNVLASNYNNGCGGCCGNF